MLVIILANQLASWRASQLHGGGRRGGKTVTVSGVFCVSHGHRVYTVVQQE